MIVLGRRKSDMESMAFCSNLLSLEHGSEIDKVPPEWRGNPQLSLTSVYGLSSFMFTVTGILLAVLLVHSPDRWFHPVQSVEAILWIWQGLISYKCDAIDLGVPSWSHPTDRISAIAFSLSCSYYAFIHCNGTYGRPLLTGLRGFAVIGMWCFVRSSRACRERDLAGYAFWHTSWHVWIPLAMMVFYLCAFLAPPRDCLCVVRPVPDWVTFSIPLAALAAQMCHSHCRSFCARCGRAVRCSMGVVQGETSPPSR